MFDLFNSKQGWDSQPVYAELINWQPTNAQGKSVDIIAESLNYLDDSLDYMVVREQACGKNHCQIRIMANRDGTRFDERIIQQGDRYYYGSLNRKAAVQLLEATSLNPYLSAPNKNELSRFADLVDQCIERVNPNESQTWCNATQWRELTSYTPKPDSVVQLAQLYAEDRAGTINLFPREGIGYNTKVPGRHAGESYLEKDAFIGFWGTPIGQAATPLKSEANGSLAPTLFEYLTGEKVVEGENGWGFPSLLGKLDITSAR